VGRLDDLERLRDLPLRQEELRVLEPRESHGRAGGVEQAGVEVLPGDPRHRLGGRPHPPEAQGGEGHADRLVLGCDDRGLLRLAQQREGEEARDVRAGLRLSAAHQLGAGSGLQNKRHPSDFNYALGAYRLASTAANTARWDGEIPVQDKAQYREPGVAEAFWNECMASDPTSGSRTPPSLRAPNGVLEDTFMQATGRAMWNASSIYVPTLVIAGEYDTWSFPEDREGLMRDLTNAPAKRSVLIKNATHFVLFEKPRMDFFNEVLKFLKEAQ